MNKDIGDRSNNGFLAIWCDIPKAELLDYRHWLTREHIADRIFLKGFHGVRLFTALNDEKSHFILYSTENRTVFESPEYLEVLDSPSPWTQRLMPKFGPFDRASGEQLIKFGNGYGAFAVISTIKINAPVELEEVKAILLPFMDMGDIVSVRWMCVDKGISNIKSKEKEMRTGSEGDFDYLLVAESMSESGATQLESYINSHILKMIPNVALCETSTRQVIYGEAPYEEAAC